MHQMVHTQHASLHRSNTLRGSVKLLEAHLLVADTISAGFKLLDLNFESPGAPASYLTLRRGSATSARK